MRSNQYLSSSSLPDGASLSTVFEAVPDNAAAMMITHRSDQMGLLTVHWSHDGIHANISNQYPIEGGTETIRLEISGLYVRMVYVNDSGFGSTDLEISCMYSTTVGMQTELNQMIDLQQDGNNYLYSVDQTLMNGLAIDTLSLEMLQETANSSLSNIDINQGDTNTKLDDLNFKIDQLSLRLDTHQRLIQDKVNKMFTASVRSIGHSNTEVCYLSNPAASGKTIYLYRINVTSAYGLRALAFNLTDNEVTGGSAQSSNFRCTTPYNISNGVPSVSVFRTGSTSTQTENRIFDMWTGVGLSQELLKNEILQIDQNTSLLIDATEGADNNRMTINFYWYEE
jgi:hypothetical protein